VAGDKTAFEDAAGYERFVAEKENAFARELSKQLSALEIASDVPRVEIVDRDARNGIGAVSLDIVQLRVPLRDEDAEFLDELYDLAVSRFGGPAWASYGPDSDYREITFSSRGRVVRLASWHPTAERSANTVAASYGVTSLGGQDREAFLADDDPAYVAQRKAFDEIAARLREHYGRGVEAR
jgi:hypothetical protein